MTPSIISSPCLALFLSMLVNRKSFSLRGIGIFLLSAAPFTAWIVLSVALYHLGETSGGERALMDEIYATFAWPVCCDPEFFFRFYSPVQALVAFLLVPILAHLWPFKPASLAVFIIQSVRGLPIQNR